MKTVTSRIGTLTAAAICAAIISGTAGCGGGGAPVFDMYAADGRRGVMGYLYGLDPATGSFKPIGPIGFPVSAIAFDEEGNLWGTTVRGFQNWAADGLETELIQIDKVTGKGTKVKTLGGVESGDGKSPMFGDIEFVDGKLYGAARSTVADNNVQFFAEVNPTTGKVTVIDEVDIVYFGNGLALDPDSGNLVFAPEGDGDANGGVLYEIDPSDFEYDDLTGLDDARGEDYGNGIGALTFFDGTLYGVIQSWEGEDVLFVTINPSNGKITVISALPPGVDAIASPKRP